MTPVAGILTLTLYDPPFKVSALSSLFRSLKAAVRETAAGGEPVENLFSNQEGPFLVTEVSNTLTASWFSRCGSRIEKTLL